MKQELSTRAGAFSSSHGVVDASAVHALRSPALKAELLMQPTVMVSLPDNLQVGSTITAVVLPRS
jgi:hypothetical protein